MKRRFCLTFLLITVVFLSTAEAQQTAEITPTGIGYLQYLPDHYKPGAGKFPLVISLHGIKEKGASSTDRAKVLKDLPNVANVGLAKYVRQGKKFPFILISPQLKSNHGSWPPEFIMDVLNHVKNKLQVDENRIYLTGLSLGGFGVWKTVGEYPTTFAAISALCPGGNALDRANAIAAANVPAWGFHGSSDHIASYTFTTKMINAINSAPKKPDPLAKATIFAGMGHVIWDKAYLETNVLNWMLGFSKDKSSSQSSESSSSSNKPPVADAGGNRTLTLPNDALTLSGNGSDPDGKVDQYLWKRVSGAPAGMGEARSPELKVFDLKAGEYVFRLTVKDEDGAGASDEVMVTVKPRTNLPPEVNAGPDKTIQLPNASVHIAGSATDPDGEIVSYQWEKVSGGQSSLYGTDSEKLQASNLEKGQYVFQLTAKDNDGAITSDHVRVTVVGASAENTPPIVHAGSDRTLTLPENSTTLSGQATDDDGTITSLQWSKISGPAASVGQTNSAQLRITGMQQGTYVFRLSAKDDEGATGQAEVTIRVTARRSAFSVESIQPVDYTPSNRSDRLPYTLKYLNGNWTNSTKKSE